MENLKLLKQLNVLFVDDDPTVCNDVCNILKYYFHDVKTATSANEAMELYSKGRWHLLLVDYDMPVMNGYEFLKQIREKDDKVPAVIISSYDDKDKLFNAMKLELVDYLVKPYSIDELKNLFHLVIEWMQRKGLVTIELSSDTTYNYISKLLIIKNEETNLTTSEYKILEALLKNENRVMTYETLVEYIEEISNKKSLINQMYKLQKKLGDKFIKNVKFTGYMYTR